jgi:hypothetical protein
MIQKFAPSNILDEIDVSLKYSVQTEVQSELTRPHVARKVSNEISVEMEAFWVNGSEGEMKEENLKGHKVPWRVMGDDSNILGVMLALTLELWPESLHLVLRAIQKWCW